MRTRPHPIELSTRYCIKSFIETFSAVLGTRPQPAMYVDDLFTDDLTTLDEIRLRTELLQDAIKGPVDHYSDVELASALVDLLHQELEAFGTGGGNRVHQSNTEEFRLLVHACKRVTQRLGLEFPDLPFRDMPGFRDYWIEQGMDWSWAKRRNYLNRLLGDLHDAIDELQYQVWEDSLFAPITPHSSTGWSLLDSEIEQLRHKFAIARTEQDHSAIGNSCVRVLELLGDIAFDPAKYLSDGEEVPARDKTKNRFDKIINCELAGRDNDEMRGYARKLVELAHMVKHRATQSRKDAGIAADGVIALANMIRRITLT